MCFCGALASRPTTSLRAIQSEFVPTEALTIPMKLVPITSDNSSRCSFSTSRLDYPSYNEKASFQVFH